nr:unnamed protein product [Digitaria exilis]
MPLCSPIPFLLIPKAASLLALSAQIHPLPILQVRGAAGPRWLARLMLLRDAVRIALSSGLVVWVCPADIKAITKQGGLWTKSLMVEKGLAYWRLNGYCDNSTILVQEYADDEFMANKDKWFVFTEDEEKVIEEYIATR